MRLLNHKILAKIILQFKISRLMRSYHYKKTKFLGGKRVLKLITIAGETVGYSKDTLTISM